MSAKPRKPTAKPPVNLSALARQLGVSRESLRQWRLEGVDLSKPEQLAERVARMHTGTAGSEPMKAERLRKLRADASLAEHELEKRRGEVLPADMVETLFAGFVQSVIFEMKRLPRELPAILDGLSAPKMGESLLDYRDAIILKIAARMETIFAELGIKSDTPNEP